MPATNEPEKSEYEIRVKAETRELLRKVVKRSGKTQDEFMTSLLEVYDTFNVFSPNWRKRIEAAERAGKWHLQREEYYKDKDRCASFREADEKWKCIVGRIDKTPMIRILAEEKIDALNLCEGCTVTLEPKLKIREYRKRIENLEGKIVGMENVELVVPICRAVGILSGDSTGFFKCQERQMKFADIEKFCKIKHHGKPCIFFEGRIVGVGRKRDET